MLYDSKTRATELVDDPIFILGHWRSGTTLLHELMSCDEQFATPTTFQCFAANHFLLTESWMPKLLFFIIPSKRPMDNVKVGWQAPQEDEFALCSMGVPSPYLRIAFPKTGDDLLGCLDLAELSQSDLGRWESALHLFLQRVTFSTGKRIILKSPTHTARVKTLDKLYPRARFIHITRDPLSVFPSTIKLWNALDEAQGLQFRRHPIDAYIFQAFERMYGAFERDRAAISQNRIVDVRYEDLVSSPIEQIERIYGHLQLKSLDDARANLTAYVNGMRDYRTNQHNLSGELRQFIETEFADYRGRYGYESVAS